MIAFDNETFLIERFSPLPKVVCSTFYTGTGDVMLIKRGPDLLHMVTALLADDTIEFVGLNVAYDFGTLAFTYPELLPAIFEAYRQGRVTDIGIRQQLFDVACGRVFAEDKLQAYSLNALSKLLLGEAMSGKSAVKGDPWRLRYGELDDVPVEDWPQETIDYAKQDSKTTWDIWNLQAGDDNFNSLVRDDRNQTYAAFVLTLIASYGMRTNSTAVAMCKAKHKQDIVKLLPELEAAGLIVDGVKKVKPAQARIEAACKAKKIKIPMTKTGKSIATDKIACLMSGDELMLKRAKYTTAEKMLTTYIPFLEGGIEGPVATRFNLAATGRTTSSAPSPPLVGGNLQQAPREGGIRECFYPREGTIYLAADFSGAELYTLAQVLKNKLGHTKLGETLNSGRDVHSWLASYLIDVSYEEIVERILNEDKVAMAARYNAKAANFGFPGGMGIGTFIKDQLKKTERLWTWNEASRLKNIWMSAFPEMKEYFELCNHEVGPLHKARIESITSGRIRTVKSFPACANHYFQSLAADGSKAALCEVTRRCYVDKNSKLYGSRPCNFIHDEIILETLNYRAAAPALKLHMENSFNAFVPDYPTSVEVVAMKYWSKKAKPVYDTVGNLIPWEGK